MPLSFWPLVLSFLLWGLQSWQPAVFEGLWPLLLGLGLVFPGIPHGAADHRVALGKKALAPSKLVLFTLLYLLVMALVVVLWWWHSGLGLGLFLLYSAWHFGEADLKAWGQAHFLAGFIWGAGLLSFILISHAAEFAHFLEAYALANWQLQIIEYYGILLVFSALALLSPLLLAPQGRSDYAFSLMLILLGSFLPLILAFGLYFIGIHSVRGWGQMRQLLGLSHGQLLRYSAPFSLGAFALAAAAFGFFSWEMAWLPWAFIFLAAISAPHVLVMSLRHYWPWRASLD